MTFKNDPKDCVRYDILRALPESGRVLDYEGNHVLSNSPSWNIAKDSLSFVASHKLFSATRVRPGEVTLFTCIG